MPNIDLCAALAITTRIVACGVILSALELISIRQHFGPKGVFSLDIASLFHRDSIVLHVVNRFIPLILAVQVAASVVLAALGPFSVLGRLMLAISFLAAMMIRWRRHIGGDGAEQMAMLVFAATGLAVWPYPSVSRIKIAVLFVVAQVSLSYVTAGIAKLTSPLWRNGSALPAILSTHNHGHPWAASLLQQHPWFAFLASWSTIIFECLFPLLILGPSWLVVTTLILGLAFHALCAVLMGLNSFLWSFPAVYPCVIALVTSGRSSV